MEAFSDSFRTDLSQLMRWRRDVRRFRSDPVDEALLMQCLDTFRLASSVGLSEPWRIVRVTSTELRQKSIENCQTANATALKGYDGGKAAMYSGLKLSDMSEAPEKLQFSAMIAPPKAPALARRLSQKCAAILLWVRSI